MNTEIFYYMGFMTNAVTCGYFFDKNIIMVSLIGLGTILLMFSYRFKEC